MGSLDAPSPSARPRRAQPAPGLERPSRGELSFVVPVRVDGPDRLWNLKATLAFLDRHFAEAEVIVVEHAAAPQLADVCAAFGSVVHLPLRSGERFSKAAAVNAGALAATRRRVCLYDADILLAPQAMDAALDCLDRHGWRFVVPYNRICLDVSGVLRQTLAASDDFRGLDRVRHMTEVAGLPDVAPRFVEGGILVADRELFLAEGGVNRKMRSYGWEDTEMVLRFARLGFPVLFLSRFSLIHLNHGRGEDSVQNSLSLENREEYLRVRGLSRQALRRYVECELSLSLAGQPEALATLRARQGAPAVLGWRALWSRVSQLRLHLQAHGVRAVLRRLLAKAHAAR